ncbi:hypothetical protein [Lacipirellula sp.]|uniref:hypothetical protein n=1 Tax=Lacipirellula sp. TaxID=2691419 RepID=UPI003D0FEFB3
MRSHVLCIIASLAIGCSASPPESPLSSPAAELDTNISYGQARAVIAASDWIIANGGDPNAVEFDASAGGNGWSVLISYLPQRAGGHAILLLDEDFKILDVLGGS